MYIKRFIYLSLLCTTYALKAHSQHAIPFDTVHWNIKAQGYILEHYKGFDAMYIQQGRATLKDAKFTNGTIEFDVFLTERRAFPGVYFRLVDRNGEAFYMRPHLPGKPDANQAAPITNGIIAWQLYFGELYSFPYEYKYDDWTHVKLLIKDDKAQIFLDHSKTPQLTWKLKQPVRSGELAIGGSFAPMYFANFKYSSETPELVTNTIQNPQLIDGIIKEWAISDKFNEEELNDPLTINKVIHARTWIETIKIEENSAANISWIKKLNNNKDNTVFARITVHSSKDQTKLFWFGYSDRVIAIVNGNPIYKGNNGYRSRDYRYLGTIGLFDSIYVHLKKGENTILFAVSEDFGGWGIMGKFENYDGIKVKP